MACDASGIASRLGLIVSTNIVLIGYSAGTGLVPFKLQDLRRVLESVSRAKFLRMNFTALDGGFQERSLLKRR